MFKKEYVLPDGTNKTTVMITCDIAGEKINDDPALLVCAKVVDSDNHKSHIRYDTILLYGSRLFNLVTKNPGRPSIIQTTNILNLFHDTFTYWCSDNTVSIDKEPPEVCKTLFDRSGCSWQTTPVAYQFAQTIIEDIKTHYRNNFEKNYYVSSMPEDMALVYKACHDLYNFKY